MSKITPVFRALISEGALNFLDAARVKEYLSVYEGKTLEVIMAPKVKKRTDKQNRYYWGVVVAMVADWSGQGREDIHEFFKKKFGKIKMAEFRDKDGNIVYEEIPVSTTKLLTVEFEDYAASIRRWAAEFCGLDIPLPNECALGEY